MRTYETIYIVHPEAGEDEVAKIVQDVESLITSNGGAIVHNENWGKRKLAYRVKHCAEGYFILVRFSCEPTFVDRLEGMFRIHERIIRYLIVYFDDQTLKLEEIQQKRNLELSRMATEREQRGRGRDDDDDDDDEPMRDVG